MLIYVPGRMSSCDRYQSPRTSSVGPFRDWKKGTNFLFCWRPLRNLTVDS